MIDLGWAEAADLAGRVAPWLGTLVVCSVAVWKVGGLTLRGLWRAHVWFSTPRPAPPPPPVSEEVMTIAAKLGAADRAAGSQDLFYGRTVVSPDGSVSVGPEQARRSVPLDPHEREAVRNAFARRAAFLDAVARDSLRSAAAAGVDPPGPAKN